MPPLVALTANVARAIEAAKDPELNRLEAAMAQMPQIEFPVMHRVTPGLYTREIFMPAGSILTSKIHKTDHQYIVSKGRASVRVDGVWQEIVAPFHGFTKAGTRRVLAIHEDTIWTTFHPTEKTDLVEIESELIHKHDHGSLELLATAAAELTGEKLP